VRTIGLIVPPKPNKIYMNQAQVFLNIRMFKVN
jgi:hypothetical protein